MPIYTYKHPKTGELFDVLRNMSDMDRPYISEDGAKCKRVFSLPRSLGYINKNAEVFEVARDYTKKCNPKYVKFRDGHRERYDPTKHC
jgi:hypothetical protein